MFAYVKFLCDGCFSIVPTSYIQDFNCDSWSTKTTYSVFWSPQGEEPNAVNINKKKLKTNTGPGYYKALVLQLAATEEEMEEKLEKSRVRCTTSKFLSDVDQSDQDEKLLKRQETKNSKLLLKKGATSNVEDILKIAGYNKPNKISKVLFPNQNTDDPQSSESSNVSFENSDDDVVPKKMYDELKGKYEELKQNSVPKSSYNKLEKKYKTLKEKFTEISDLNIKFQKKMFKSSINSPFSVKANQTSDPPHHTTPTSSLKIQNVSPSPEATSIQPPPPSHDLANDFPQPADDTQQTTASSATKDFKIDKEKLILAQQVKRGQPGDSQYAKNLAAMIWDPSVLEMRSVTGRKSNAVKKCDVKPRLTPEKLDYLKGLFKERIISEEPGCSSTEIQLRTGQVNQFIAQKIATLNRKTDLLPIESNQQ